MVIRMEVIRRPTGVSGVGWNAKPHSLAAAPFRSPCEVTSNTTIALAPQLGQMPALKMMLLGSSSLIAPKIRLPVGGILPTVHVRFWFGLAPMQKGTPMA